MVSDYTSKPKDWHHIAHKPIKIQSIFEKMDHIPGCNSDKSAVATVAAFCTITEFGAKESGETTSNEDDG